MHPQTDTTLRAARDAFDAILVGCSALTLLLPMALLSVLVYGWL